MRRHYDLGDQTLRNLSDGASAMFLRHGELTEGESGLPSGIGPAEDDEARCPEDDAWDVPLPEKVRETARFMPR
ncbi:hypothetical protein ACFZAU_19195 [Streptomyces sp. NPDC008238]